MNWHKLDESNQVNEWGYADYAADEYDREMDAEVEYENEVEDDTENLDDSDVFEKYFETKALDYEEWVSDLFEKLYDFGLVDFYDYSYHHEDGWLEFPKSTVEMNDDGCVFISDKLNKFHKNWEEHLDKFLSENKEYGKESCKSGVIVVKSGASELVSETFSISGKGTIQCDDDIVRVYKPNGESEYLGKWEECPYYRDELEYHSYNNTYICYNPDDEADENDEYRIIVLVAEA